MITQWSINLDDDLVSFYVLQRPTPLGQSDLIKNWPLMACVASANFEDHPPPTQLAKRRKKRPSTIGKHCLLVAPSLAPNYMHQRWPQERNCKKDAFHSFQYLRSKKGQHQHCQEWTKKILRQWSLSKVLLQSLVLFRKHIQHLWKKNYFLVLSRDILCLLIFRFLFFRLFWRSVNNHHGCRQTRWRLH